MKIETFHFTFKFLKYQFETRRKSLKLSFRKLLKSDPRKVKEEII